MRIVRWAAKYAGKNAVEHEYFNGDIAPESLKFLGGEISIGLQGFRAERKGAYEVHLYLTPSEALEILNAAEKLRIQREIASEEKIRDLHSKINELQAQIQSLTQKDGT